MFALRTPLALAPASPFLNTRQPAPVAPLTPRGVTVSSATPAYEAGREGWNVTIDGSMGQRTIFAVTQRDFNASLEQLYASLERSGFFTPWAKAARAAAPAMRVIPVTYPPRVLFAA